MAATGKKVDTLKEPLNSSEQTEQTNTRAGSQGINLVTARSAKYGVVNDSAWNKSCLG